MNSVIAMNQIVDTIGSNEMTFSESQRYVALLVSTDTTQRG